MPVAHPCSRCRLAQECEIRAEKLKAVRGLKLTTIKFRCDVRRDDMKAGMVATCEFPYVTTGAYIGPDTHEWQTEKLTLLVVVMGWSQVKHLRVWVYPNQTHPETGKPVWLQSFQSGIDRKQLRILKVDPRKVTPLVEIVPVCKYCGLPEQAEEPDWNCSNRDSEGPLGCIYGAPTDADSRGDSNA